MRYRITHLTSYSYETPVSVCHNRLILAPRPDWTVQVETHRVQIRPHPTLINRREDVFGNTVHTFSLEEPHRQLVVSSTGRIEVNYDPLPMAVTTPSWESVVQGVQDQTDPRWLDACQFRFDSPRVNTEPEGFRQYAMESFGLGRPILEAALEFNSRIHHDFEYDTTATEVHTPAIEAFQARRGVCQDFAHVAIACLRAIGIPARYASGYLRTEAPPGSPRLIGADQSHAWVSIYCGQQVGWVDFDPTNNKLCDHDHIPIAWGRDYWDVVPVKGVFLGGGAHRVSVSVDVAPLEA